MRIQPWTEEALMAHEDVFEALVSKALKQTVRKIQSELRGGVLVAAVDDIPDPVSTPAPPPTTAPPVSFAALEGAVMAVWNSHVDAELFPFLTRTFVSSAARVAAGVKDTTGRIIEQLTNPYAVEYLQFAHNRMVGIGEQLWAKMRDEMTAGFQAGEGIREIAARLQQVAGLATPRALTTARTEVIGAANGGSYAQMLAAGFDDTEVTKVWLATEDTRTRISHRHADNQGVQLTDEFAIDIYSEGVKTGTEGLEFPGDPTGTPGNVINCRCSLAFDFADENESGPMTAASYFNEKLHPRDEHGKFTKKGSVTKLFKELTSAEKLTAISTMTAKDWQKLSAEDKAGLVEGIDSLPDTSAKKLAQKKLKTFGGAEPPAKDAPQLEKIKFLAGKIDQLTPAQRVLLLKQISADDWDALDKDVKDKIRKAALDTSHPETKKEAQDLLDNLDAGTAKGGLTGKVNVKTAIEDAAKAAAPKARPQGGTSKSGKELVPGKPVQLKVQFLYNTAFEDGAVMAVRKDSDERLVWDGKNEKILRQKKGSDGKFATVETKTRGDAYKAWKDEDGWTVPDSTPAAAASPTAPTAGTLGKPTSIKVQLIYQTPYNDGDTVAVNPGTGQKITWNAGKKRMVVHEADGSSKEYTRGALYKEFKDSTGWYLPGDEGSVSAAPESAVDANPQTTELLKKAAVAAGNSKLLDKGDGYEIWTVYGGAQIQVASSDGSESVELDKAGLTDDALNKAIADVKAAVAKAAAPKPAPVKPSKAKISDILSEAILEDNANIVFENDDFEVTASKSFVLISGKNNGADAQLLKAGLTTDKFSKAIDSVLAGDSIKESKPSAPTTPGGEAFNAYQTATPNVAFYDVDGVKIVKGSDGSVFMGNGSSFGGLKSADVTPENLEKAIAAIKADLSWAAGEDIPAPALNPPPAPSTALKTGAPLKLTAAVLTGPKTKAYVHGQVIAVHPGENERLVWNATTKKYDVQTPVNGVWTTGFSYNKSGALANLKDDDGWHSPLPGQEFGDGTPSTITVSGTPSAPSVTTPGTPTPISTKPVSQKQDEADKALSGLTASQQTDLFNSFKNTGGTIYLSSSAEELFAKALKVQDDFNKAHNTKLNALAVLRHVDVTTSSKLGVVNNNAYEKKVADWLQTSAGAKRAAELLAESRMTPAEKAAAAAAKAAALKAAADKKLQDLHAVKVSVPAKTTAATKFKASSVALGDSMSKVMLDAQPWTAAEKSALKKYTGSYYSTVNNALRGKGTITPQILEDAINIQKSMRPLPESIILHRGVGAIPGILPGDIAAYANLIGKTFVEPGFSSTSVGGKAAFGGKVKLVIEAPKGTPAAWAKPISHYNSENEMLLAANTKFQIMEATPSGDGYSITVRVRIVP